MKNYLNSNTCPSWIKITRKTSIFSFFIIFALSLLIACGGGSKESDEIPNTSFDITESDFNLPFITMLSDQEFKDSLNSNIDFMAEEDGIIETKADEFDCLIAKVGDTSASLNQENEYEFNIKDTDFTECFSFDDINLKSVTTSWYITNMKLEDASGNPVNDEMIKFSDDDKYTVLQSNFRIYIRMIGELKGVTPTYTFQSITLISSNKTNNFNEPCQRVPVFTDCVSREATALGEFGRPAPELLWKTVLYADNLNVTPDKQYFADGQILFDINNWKGTMSYQADASNPPTYTASDGADTITGTFEYSEGGSSVASQKASFRASGMNSSSGYSDYLYQILPTINKIISNIEKKN